MVDFKDIRNKILTDDKFASTVQYLFSKVILEQPVKPLKFVYKKHLFVKGFNKKFSVYSLETNKKIFSGIYFQDVAKYVVKNIKNTMMVNHILYLEKEYFRFLDKINFLEKSYLKHPRDIILIKLDSDYSTLNKIKKSLIYNLYYKDS